MNIIEIYTSSFLFLGYGLYSVLRPYICRIKFCSSTKLFTALRQISVMIGLRWALSNRAMYFPGRCPPHRTESKSIDRSRKIRAWETLFDSL